MFYIHHSVLIRMICSWCRCRSRQSCQEARAQCWSEVMVAETRVVVVVHMKRREEGGKYFKGLSKTLINGLWTMGKEGKLDDCNSFYFSHCLNGCFILLKWGRTEGGTTLEK